MELRHRAQRLGEDTTRSRGPDCSQSLISRWTAWFELSLFLARSWMPKMEGETQHSLSLSSVTGCVLLPHLNAENTSMSEYPQ